MENVKIKKGRTNDGTITFSEFIKFVLNDAIIIRTIPMLEKIQKSRDCKALSIFKYLFSNVLSFFLS